MTTLHWIKVTYQNPCEIDLFFQQQQKYTFFCNTESPGNSDDLHAILSDGVLTNRKRGTTTRSSNLLHQNLSLLSSLSRSAPNKKSSRKIMLKVNGLTNVLMVSSHSTVQIPSSEHGSGRVCYEVLSLSLFCARDGLILVPPDIDDAVVCDQASLFFLRFPLLKQLREGGSSSWMKGSSCQQTSRNEFDRGYLNAIVQSPRLRKAKQYSPAAAEIKVIGDAIRAVT